MPQPRRSNLIIVFLVLTTVTLSYRLVLRNNFVSWGDPEYLLENPSVRSLDGQRLKEIFTSRVSTLYIPLTSLSFAIEYRLFGGQPFFYHLDNLILHLAVVILIFHVGMRWGLSLAGAATAALLFGIHPLNVESVAWVTGRKEVLAFVFYLLALNSYTSYLNTKRKLLYGHTFLWGILSMLMNPSAMGLPFALLLCDWFWGRSMTRRVFIEKVPYAFILIGLGAVSYWGSSMPVWLSWIWSPVFYLSQFLFPTVLLPRYPLPEPISLRTFVYPLAVVVFLLFIIGSFRFRKYKWFVFAIGFYFINFLFALSGDELDRSTTGRYVYFSSIGFCFLFGILFERLQKGFNVQWKKAKIFEGLCLIGLFAVLAAKTFEQTQVWQNSIRLWSHQLGFYPNDSVALHSLAKAYREQPEFKEAEGQYVLIGEMIQEGFRPESIQEIDAIQKMEYLIHLYQKSIRANPTDETVHFDLGNLYQNIGRLPEAIQVYQQAILLRPAFKEAYFSLAKVYEHKGDAGHVAEVYNQLLKNYPRDEDVYASVIAAYNNAIRNDRHNDFYEQQRLNTLKAYEQLLKEKAPHAVSYFNLGVLYTQMDDYPKAVEAYQKALNRNPRYVEALYNLGNIFMQFDQFEQATRLYERVLSIDPRFSNAYLNLGIIAGRQGDHKKAERLYWGAIATDPQNANAYFNLGFVYESIGKVGQAIDHYQKAIQTDPSHAEAYYNLGNAYFSLGEYRKAIESYQKTIKINPNHLSAYVNLSITSFKIGDYPRAAQYCEEAILLGYKPPEDYLKALAPYRRQFSQSFR